MEKEFKYYLVSVGFFLVWFIHYIIFWRWSLMINILLIITAFYFREKGLVKSGKLKREDSDKWIPNGKRRTRKKT